MTHDPDYEALATHAANMARHFDTFYPGWFTQITLHDWCTELLWSERNHWQSMIFVSLVAAGLITPYEVEWPWKGSYTFWADEVAARNQPLATLAP
jgi:hypothetical protein